MERWLRYPEYQYLAESEAPFVDPLGTVRKYPTTLYPDGRALDFMDSLYAQLLPNFESENFNIGGDEPWELGMGRSRARCAAEGGKYGVYIAHMLGLRERAAKYGKKVCFWADVLMQSPEYSELLPCDMTPILWGYYLDHPYEEQCSYMKGLGRDFLVAPGTSTWNSFGSRWDCAFKNIQTACGCAKRHGARGMILTQWGDGGNHQPWCAMYPAIAAASGVRVGRGSDGRARLRRARQVCLRRRFGRVFPRAVRARQGGSRPKIVLLLPQDVFRLPRGRRKVRGGVRARLRGYRGARRTSRSPFPKIPPPVAATPEYAAPKSPSASR